MPILAPTLAAVTRVLLELRGLIMGAEFIHAQSRYGGVRKFVALRAELVQGATGDLVEAQIDQALRALGEVVEALAWHRVDAQSPPTDVPLLVCYVDEDMRIATFSEHGAWTRHPREGTNAEDRLITPTWWAIRPSAPQEPR